MTIKLPYVDQYKFLESAEVREAEEFLNEYNDFYLYNQSQINDIFRKVDESGAEDDPVALEKIRQRAELTAKAATDKFAEYFGCKDFALSAMVGLKLAWDDIQQILLEEFRKRTAVEDSAMSYIGPQLRAVASVLLFSEYLHYKLGRMFKDSSEKNAQHNAKVEAAKMLVEQKFTEMLQTLERGEKISIPEFFKSKKQLEKLRNVDSIIEFVAGIV